MSSTTEACLPAAAGVTKAKSIQVRQIHSPSQLPADYGTTPGGTLFGTTPGGVTCPAEKTSNSPKSGRAPNGQSKDHGPGRGGHGVRGPSTSEEVEIETKKTEELPASSAGTVAAAVPSDDSQFDMDI